MPEVRGPIWYEHWHRYAAVAPLAAGKRVRYLSRLTELTGSFCELSCLNVDES